MSILSQSPLVSVITVCFNSEATISKTLKSVVSQDYGNIEYIVIDGASTDSTLDILERHSNAIDFMSSEPDSGIYEAINKGLKAAHGEIIAILNSDDRYVSSHVISDAVKYFQQKNVDAVLSDIEFIENLSVDKKKRKIKADWFKPWRLRFGWMPPHPGMFLKSSVYEKYGLYSEDYEIAADYEFVVRIFLKGSASYYLSGQTTVYMNLGGTSTKGISSTLKISREIVKSCRLNGIYTNSLLVSLRLPLKFLLMIGNR